MFATIDLYDMKYGDIIKFQLFGHQVGGRMQTHWMCFMKIPKEI